MKRLIDQVEEIRRRFNFEIDTIIEDLKKMEQLGVNNSKLLESKKEDVSKEKYVTLKRLCQVYPSFTQGGIRSMIFQNKWRFDDECVSRFGKRLMIDVEKFEAWIKKPKHPKEAYAHLR